MLQLSHNDHIGWKGTEAKLVKACRHKWCLCNASGKGRQRGAAYGAAEHALHQLAGINLTPHMDTAGTHIGRQGARDDQEAGATRREGNTQWEMHCRLWASHYIEITWQAAQSVRECPSATLDGSR